MSQSRSREHNLEAAYNQLMSCITTLQDMPSYRDELDKQQMVGWLTKMAEHLLEEARTANKSDQVPPDEIKGV